MSFCDTTVCFRAFANLRNPTLIASSAVGTPNGASVFSNFAQLSRAYARLPSSQTVSSICHWGCDGSACYFQSSKIRLLSIKPLLLKLSSPVTLDFTSREMRGHKSSITVIEVGSVVILEKRRSFPAKLRGCMVSQSTGYVTRSSNTLGNARTNCSSHTRKRAYTLPRKLGGSSSVKAVEASPPRGWPAVESYV